MSAKSSVQLFSFFDSLRSEWALGIACRIQMRQMVNSKAMCAWSGKSEHLRELVDSVCRFVKPRATGSSWDVAHVRWVNVRVAILSGNTVKFRDLLGKA